MDPNDTADAISHESEPTTEEALPKRGSEHRS